MLFFCSKGLFEPNFLEFCTNLLLKSGNGSGQCRFYVRTAPGDELVYCIYYIKVRVRARNILLLPVCYLTCWLVPAGRLTVGVRVAGRAGRAE